MRIRHQEIRAPKIIERAVETVKKGSLRKNKFSPMMLFSLFQEEWVKFLSPFTDPNSFILGKLNTPGYI